METQKLSNANFYDSWLVYSIWLLDLKTTLDGIVCDMIFVDRRGESTVGPFGHRWMAFSLTNTACGSQLVCWVLFILQKKLFSRSKKTKKKLSIKGPKEKALASHGT